MTQEFILPNPLDEQGNVTPLGRSMHRFVGASLSLKRRVDPNIAFGMSEKMVRKSAGIMGYEGGKLKRALEVEKLPPTETLAVHLEQAGVPYWVSLPSLDAQTGNGNHSNGNTNGKHPSTSQF